MSNDRTFNIETCVELLGRVLDGMPVAEAMTALSMTMATIGKMAGHDVERHLQVIREIYLGLDEGTRYHDMKELLGIRIRGEGDYGLGPIMVLRGPVGVPVGIMVDSESAKRILNEIFGKGEGVEIINKKPESEEKP